MKHVVGDQWIKEIDGVRHMEKAVVGTDHCLGCSIDDGSAGCERLSECSEGENYIFKDLGPVNEDGCLSMPCDGKTYPEVAELIGDIWQAKAQSGTVFMEARGRGKQKCIDAWNRRELS